MGPASSFDHDALTEAARPEARSPAPVYLDYAATTPVAPEVAREMARHLTLEGTFGNPASRSHDYGFQAENAVETARARVAALVGAKPHEIVWTSGATEANNLAIKGAAEAYRASHAKGGHVIVSAIEHKSVLDPARWLEKSGFSLTLLRPRRDGLITPEELRAALRDDTFLVSIMAVNNELGSLNDLAKLSASRSDHVSFHSDGAQAAGKAALDVDALGLDFLSLSAHKFYGPKGIGALYVRESARSRLATQMHGGGHEWNLRSGTLPTHQCVGMGAAAEVAQHTLASDAERIARLRDELWQGLSRIPRSRRNGSAERAVSGILNVTFEGLADRAANGGLLSALSGLAVSSGSACNSADGSASYVLRAIGLTDEQAQASLRFSLGRYTTSQDVDFAVKQVTEAVSRLLGSAG